MSASGKCRHLEFRATVDVQLMEDTGMKYAELRVHCVHCGKPAIFRGDRVGLSPNEPMLSLDREEAILPFLLDGDDYNGKGIGYSVTSLGGD